MWFSSKDYIKSEIEAQTAIIDGHCRRIEAAHGTAGRERAVHLSMQSLRRQLTQHEQAELAHLCDETSSNYSKAAE